jgi:type II secretory pathway pseudopilin PulG
MKPKRETSSRRRQGAFSLPEMAVALVITGLLMIGVWKLLPVLRSGDAQTPEQQLAQADAAVVGFVLKNYRLPCPANSNGNGAEVVATGGGCTVTAGELPFRTLGIHLPMRLRYAVYQDTNKTLTKPVARFRPIMPAAATGSVEWPLQRATSDNLVTILTGTATQIVRESPTTAEITAASNRVNGLDFCDALRTTMRSASADVFPQADGVAVAYVLAHPGAGDADGDGNPFDWLNASALASKEFAPPGTPATNEYDDHVMVTGFAQLAGRLACPTYLARVNAAANTALSAHDNLRFSLAMLQYFAFDLDLSVVDAQRAYKAASKAALDLAMTSLGELRTLLGSLEFPTAFAAIAGSINLIKSSMAMPKAIKTLLDAEKKVRPVCPDDKPNCAEALKKAPVVADVENAKKVRVEMEKYAHSMAQIATKTAQRALELDEKGLMP